MEYEKAKPHLIAYIDILGTSEMLASGKSDEFIHTIDSAYQTWIEVESRTCAKGFPKIDIKTFSDNIILSCPFDGAFITESQSKIASILAHVCRFQGEMLRINHLLTRGGVCFGDLVWNETLVLGSGLVEAHMLESRIAIYPRIVFSDAFFRLVKQFLPNRIEDHILQDQDGVYYANFMHHSPEGIDENEVGEATRFCLSQMELLESQPHQNLRAIQNYKWTLSTIARMWMHHNNSTGS